MKETLTASGIPRDIFIPAVDLEFVVYMTRWIDADNITLKFFIDALRDWGVIEDDSPKYVRSIKVSVLKDKNERIEVIIYENTE